MDTRHYPTRAGARVRGGRPQPAPPAVLSGPQSSSSSKVLRLGFTAAAARTRASCAWRACSRATHEGCASALGFPPPPFPHPPATPACERDAACPISTG
jgi:hypothetical protein